MSRHGQVFRDENDQRQRMDHEDQQAEMMADQDYADHHVLKNVLHGTTTYRDYLYLVGRLNINLNDMEE